MRLRQRLSLGCFRTRDRAAAVETEFSSQRALPAELLLLLLMNQKSVLMTESFPNVIYLQESAAGK
jgi:hypothetical protein